MKSTDDMFPADPATLRELDALAGRTMTEKQRADLEAMPTVLPALSDDDLLDKAKDALKRHRRFRAAIEQVDVDDADLDDLAALMHGEVLWRTICRKIGDECERRRTGIAPRAKGMN